MILFKPIERIVLVTDNLNIHSPACLYERFEPAEARRIATRFEWHFTPKHASWLNIAECELSVLKRQALKGRLPDIETVTQKATAWEQRRNQMEATIDWRFTTEDARIKLKRLYPIVNIQKLT
jgi:transposase